MGRDAVVSGRRRGFPSAAAPAQRMRDMQERSGMALRRFVALALAGTVLAACAAAPAKNVNATLEEWKITVSPTTGAAGEVTFTIDNIGEKDHELVVVKTDLAPDKLPTTADGDVDEEGAGMEAIGEMEDILAGTDDNELKLTLTAGKYVVFCNVVDEDLVHYAKGMHTAFTVE
jgi:uncharacterized cupredoxin-like copper-binding protein